MNLPWNRATAIPERAAECPECGHAEPILVAATHRVSMGARVRKFEAGYLARCPHCQTLFTVSLAGVRRVGPDRATPRASSSDDEKRKVIPFPQLPPDMQF